MSTDITSLSDLDFDRDCSALLEALECLAKDGSHLFITRQLIPHRISYLKKRPSAGSLKRSLSLEDHAIYVQSFVAVQDFWGLLQVGSLPLLDSMDPEFLI